MLHFEPTSDLMMRTRGTPNITRHSPECDSRPRRQKWTVQHLLQQAGKLEEALTLFEQAVRIDPSSPIARSR